MELAEYHYGYYFVIIGPAGTLVASLVPIIRI
jgi:hypothetical protein